MHQAFENYCICFCLKSCPPGTTASHALILRLRHGYILVYRPVIAACLRLNPPLGFFSSPYRPLHWQGHEVLGRTTRGPIDKATDRTDSPGAPALILAAHGVSRRAHRKNGAHREGSMTTAARFPGIRVKQQTEPARLRTTPRRGRRRRGVLSITPSTRAASSSSRPTPKEPERLWAQHIAIETGRRHAAQGGAKRTLFAQRVVELHLRPGRVYGVEQYYHAPGKGSDHGAGKWAARAHQARPQRTLRPRRHLWRSRYRLDHALRQGRQQTADQALILRRVTELRSRPHEYHGRLPYTHWSAPFTNTSRS